jgi:hypothetical protein
MQLLLLVGDRCGVSEFSHNPSGHWFEHHPPRWSTSRKVASMIINRSARHTTPADPPTPTRRPGLRIIRRNATGRRQPGRHGPCSTPAATASRPCARLRCRPQLPTGSSPRSESGLRRWRVAAAQDGWSPAADLCLRMT